MNKIRDYSEQFSKQKEALDKKFKELDRILEDIKHIDQNVIQLMDTIEAIIYKSGGEPKLQFLEVTRNMIRVYTRISIDINMYPFLPEDLSNHRLHKYITMQLLKLCCIQGIRWIPNERGCQIILTIK